MTPITERQRARFYIYKKQKKAKHLYIQKAWKFPFRFYIQNARHFTLGNFHENFEVGNYILKAWSFALCDVFIYKKPDTLQKSR